MHKAKMNNTELILESTMDELWRISIKGVNPNECKETMQPLLEIAQQLGQLRVDNLVAFASSQLASYLGSSFLRVLRYIRNNFIKCSRFPYEEDTTNEWFDLSDEGSERNKPVKAMNIVKEEGTTGKCSTILNEIQNHLESILGDDFEILFHGTSHGNAQDIIENGIDVRVGQPRQDFSSSDGFYLGDSFDEAMKWPGSRGLPNSAVLVFRVKKTELRGDVKEKGLDLRGDENKKEWQGVVSQFRSGRPDRKFSKEMKEYEFIEGPMASMSKKNLNLKYPPQKDGTYQLCVRKDKCAELFDKSLHSVLFFS